MRRRVRGSSFLPETELTVPVGTLVLLQEAARQVGIDPDRLLRGVGVEPRALQHPMTPVAIPVVARAFELARRQSGCEHFSVLAGARARLGNAGLVPLLVMHERFVRDAIADLVRFLRIWYRGVHLALEVNGNLARFTIAVSGACEGHDELCASYAASMNRHLQTIIGERWRATRVLLARARPADTRPFRQVFNAPVVFGAAENAIEFPAADLDVVRPTTDEHLNRLVRAQLIGLESERPSPTTAAQVRRLVELMLCRGDCSIEKVSEMLSVHRKTLHRHLANEGTTFRHELEEARKEAAQRLLAQGNLPVAEVALALGYKEPVNFTRAFRKWFGVPPTEWRARAVPAAAPRSDAR